MLNGSTYSSDARQADARQTLDEAARSLMMMVLRLVDVSSWRFGRVRGAGELIEFSCANPDEENLEAERFLTCYRRLKPWGLARLSLVDDPIYPHAITISFRDPVANVAMVVLLRDQAKGPFTQHERTLLALAKEVGEECLALGVPIADPPIPQQPALMRRAGPMLFILDRSYCIALEHRLRREDEATGGRFTDRLPAVIEEAVRGMTSAWRTDPNAFVSAVTMPLPFLAVRAQSMDSRDQGPYLAVTIERVRGRNVLRRASERYEITPRERDVLAYLLGGMRIEKIAERLSIAPSTVNDHIRSLIARTNSSNRSQMLARILGWKNGETTDEG